PTAAGRGCSCSPPSPWSTSRSGSSRSALCWRRHDRAERGQTSSNAWSGEAGPHGWHWSNIGDGGPVTSTGTRATRLLGAATLAALALTAVMALVVSPPDDVQGDAVRLLYLHVPTAWVAMYLSFGITTLASALYLWRRTRSRFWDLVAGASAEIGVVFLGLTLIVGSIWGRATWGVWWTWDARLTSTAVLFVLYCGYLALRRVPADTEVRARRAAI